MTEKDKTVGKTAGMENGDHCININKVIQTLTQAFVPFVYSITIILSIHTIRE